MSELIPVIVFIALTLSFAGGLYLTATGEMESRQGLPLLSMLVLAQSIVASVLAYHIMYLVTVLSIISTACLIVHLIRHHLL